VAAPVVAVGLTVAISLAALRFAVSRLPLAGESEAAR
jgi:hypothetical protein